MAPQNYCYILYNDQNNETYVGFTNNPERRLRQHNCEIAGGARFTTARHKKLGITWKFLRLITSGSPDFTKSVALSFEWHLKHAARISKRFRGPEGRILSIQHVTNLSKFKALAQTFVVIDPHVVDKSYYDTQNALTGSVISQPEYCRHTTSQETPQLEMQALQIEE